MKANKTMVLNGLVTLTGLLLDIYGLYDLSFFPALSGLAIGIIDCVTFLWMREEIKQRIAQLRSNFRQARPYMLDTWFQDMQKGKPEVAATITGRSIFNRMVLMAKKLGYEPTNISETEAWKFRRYNVTFRRARNSTAD